MCRLHKDGLSRISESSGSAQLTLHSVPWFHKCPPIFSRYFLCIYQNTRQCASETLTAHSPSLFSETSKMRLPLNVYLVFRLVACGPGLDLQSRWMCSGDEQDRKRAQSSLPSCLHLTGTSQRPPQAGPQGSRPHVSIPFFSMRPNCLNQIIVMDKALLYGMPHPFGIWSNMIL